MQINRKILETLDIKKAKRYVGANVSDEVALVGLHKARYESTNISDKLRNESREWLERQGYKRMNGLPFPPPGELP